MQAFAALLDGLIYTRSRDHKVRLIADYFRTTPDPDRGWALAALAGILAGPFLSVQPSMHLLPIVKAFAIVVVGGLGSIPGSILAAFMLGYAETLVGYQFSTSWTEIVSVLATLLMLIFRPAGIFGKRSAF